MLRVIIGPTGAGKSRIAMAIAGARGAGIVSADSRQVYRGFDVGTAKPTEAEQALVPHRGIDVLDPGERYSAHAWATDADRWSEELRARGHEPVIVGGTGFYIRALVSPLDRVPALETESRDALGAWLDALDAPTLERWCARLDPARASLGRTQRLRAVETALLSGRRLSDSLTQRVPASDSSPPPSGSSDAPGMRPVRYLVVDPGPVLASRIEQRVYAMLDAGWMAEVHRLNASVASDAPAWKASGYETLRRHVLGELSESDAVERVIIETRQYAKRQRTWCRHQLQGGTVTRLDPDRHDALERALDWWDGQSGSSE